MASVNWDELASFVKKMVAKMLKEQSPWEYAQVATVVTGGVTLYLGGDTANPTAAIPVVSGLTLLVNDRVIYLSKDKKMIVIGKVG